MSDTGNSDTNIPGSTTPEDPTQQEDERETEQVDESLEANGLLPVPEATPTDAQAPGA